MFKYNVAEKFSLEAGPYIGFLTTAKMKVDVDGYGSATEDIKDLLKSTDFGIALGMNYDFSDCFFEYQETTYQDSLTKINLTLFRTKKKKKNFAPVFCVFAYLTIPQRNHSLRWCPQARFLES